MNHFLQGEIDYFRIFHQYLKQNKTSLFPFSVERSFIIAKHSKCTLSFMGGSDFKIFMFENSWNKAQISEKLPTLHKLRYLKNSLTVLFVKLQAVRIRIPFYVGASFRLKNRTWCEIRSLNLGQVSVTIRFLRTRVLFSLARSISLVFTCCEYLCTVSTRAFIIYMLKSSIL